MNVDAIATALRNDYLNLIIMPTEKCNFRCKYCYEDFLVGKMPKNVITAVKKLIGARISTLKSLDISWFGGEPLLASDVILDIMGETIGLCSDNNVDLQAGATTNAYRLNSSLLGKLCASKVNTFHIALDGDKEMHNTTRLRADGAGTFDTIWSNLRAAQQTGYQFKILLRSHVTTANHDSILRLSERFINDFGDDDRFDIYFAKVNNYRGDEQPIYLKDIEFDKILKQINERLANLNPKRQFNGSHSVDDYICYAAMPNSLLIRSNGNLAKCTVALNDPANQIGRIREDGTIALEQFKLNFWMGGFKTLDNAQLACPAKFLKNYHQEVLQVEEEQLNHSA